MNIFEIKELLWQYVVTLYHNVPSYVYEGLLSVFCLGVVSLVMWKGKNSFRHRSLLLLVEYTFLILCSTFFFRKTQTGRSYKLEPFWHLDSPDLLPESIMNVAVFVPTGFLIGTQISQKTQKGWLVAIVVGFLISVLVEVLQLVFKRGSCDVDDVINNTIGAMIGATLWLLVKFYSRLIVKS